MDYPERVRGVRVVAWIDNKPTDEVVDGCQHALAVDIDVGLLFMRAVRSNNLERLRWVFAVMGRDARAEVGIFRIVIVTHAAPSTFCGGANSSQLSKPSSASH